MEPTYVRCLCHSDYNKLRCTVEKCVGPYLFVPLTSLKIRNLLTENPNLWHLILIHWERILQKLICMYAAKCGYCSHLVSTKCDVFGYVLFLFIFDDYVLFSSTYKFTLVNLHCLPNKTETRYPFNCFTRYPFNCFTCLLVPHEGPYFTDLQGKPAFLFTSTCH